MAARLRQGDLMLPGTVVERYLKCRRAGCGICRQQKGHGPVYYLSMRRSDGRTRMVYVPQAQLAEVRAGVQNYQELKAALGSLSQAELEAWCRRTRRHP
jgi:hypothetical protein